MATAAPRPREVTAGLPVLCMLMIWGCDLSFGSASFGLWDHSTANYCTWDSNSITCTVFSKEKPKVY
jgi:hypothetical protein